jgi:XTP/dITP diphosphohydrolase
MKRLVLASSNAGKLAELQPLLAGAGYELLTQRELGISDAVEDGRTFVENALIKARHACVGSGLPALADDSGIVVDALDGAPGLLSARYAGAHGDAQANNRKLLADLQGVPEAKRTARFVAVLVLLRHASDPLPLIAQGVWEGRVLEGARGANGFGYDPLFFDPLLGRGAAELEPELKNRVSHRGKALAQLRELLGC